MPRLWNENSFFFCVSFFHCFRMRTSDKLSNIIIVIIIFPVNERAPGFNTFRKYNNNSINLTEKASFKFNGHHYHRFYFSDNIFKWRSKLESRKSRLIRWLHSHVSFIWDHFVHGVNEKWSSSIFLIRFAFIAPELIWRWRNHMVQEITMQRAIFILIRFSSIAFIHNRTNLKRIPPNGNVTLPERVEMHSLTRFKF